MAMSMKEIIKMAINPEIMEIMEEIAEIQANMSSKTVYEARTATKRMKELARAIQELSEEC